MRSKVVFTVIGPKVGDPQLTYYSSVTLSVAEMSLTTVHTQNTLSSLQYMQGSIL